MEGDKKIILRTWHYKSDSGHVLEANDEYMGDSTYVHMACGTRGMQVLASIWDILRLWESKVLVHGSVGGLERDGSLREGVPSFDKRSNRTYIQGDRSSSQEEKSMLPSAMKTTSWLHTPSKGFCLIFPLSLGLLRCKHKVRNISQKRTEHAWLGA